MRCCSVNCLPLVVAYANLDYESEDVGSSKSSKHDTPQSSGVLEYDAYLRREFPRRIRRKLEAMIDEEISGPAEEMMLAKLEAIVRDCQENMIRDYQAQNNSGSSSSKEDHSKAQAAPEQSYPQGCKVDISWMGCEPDLEMIQDWGMLTPHPLFDNSQIDIVPDCLYSDTLDFLDQEKFSLIAGQDTFTEIPSEEPQEHMDQAYTGKGKGRA